MRYKVSGIIELIPCDDEPPSPKRLKTGHSSGDWYKSKGESTLKNQDGGFLWSPVKKPTTIHTYHDPVAFAPGDVIEYTWEWKSDGRDGSNDDLDGTRDLTGQGKGISDLYLRALAGTGDFRIGFFHSSGMVYGGSQEGKDAGKDLTIEFNTYRGFQIRWHPHLSAGFDKIKGRLIEERGKEKEPHNNLSLWSRKEAGTLGLMSDEAQRENHSGFSKSDGWGTQPVSYGAEAPFGEWVKVSVSISL